VQAALGAAHAQALLSAHKATQRADGLIRWDLTFSSVGADAAITALRAGARRRGWYARRHVPFVDRAHKAPVPRPLLRGRALATWNIGTARGKLHEIGWAMDGEQVAVVALQETLHAASHRALRMPGFSLLERCMDRDVPGARGVALATRVGIPMHEIGGLPASPNALWARVIGLDGGVDCWTVASVYVPHAAADAEVRASRRRVLEHVKETAASLLDRFDHEPMLILADWNMKLPDVSRLLQRWGSGLFVLPLAGGAGTNQVSGKAPTAIDHIVVNDAAYQRLRGKGRVLREYDLSTHWPVKAEVTMADAVLPAAGAEEPQVPILVSRVIRANRFGLAMHNNFSALAENLDDVIAGAGTDAAVSLFNEAVRGACADIGAVQRPKSARAPPVYQFAAETKRLITASRAASSALHVTGKMSRDPVKVAAAAAARKAARDAQKADVARSKQRRLARAVAGLYDGLRPDVFWRFLRDEVDGPRAPASMTQPVVDSKGTLRVIPSEVREVWAQHYRELSTAKGGRRNRQWWAEHHPLPQKSELAGLNEPICWKETVAALKATPDGTAAGADGIPPSALRAALLRSNGNAVTEEDVCPQTPLGEVLLRLINELFDSGVTPATLASATVVNVPKAGADPTDKDGYRGVSLIACLLKLVDRVVIERVYQSLIAKRRIRREQAGFRKAEEAIGQVCALVETVGRRIRVGKKTYLAFIDFRKAFDKVSHGALMHRLSAEGVRGKALKFFEAQYESPTLRVRVGGALSEVIALETGVRQGAPSSPVLFDVFIDSILDEMAGILVPGLPSEEATAIMAGLLFADDAVLLAESAEDLEASLAKLGAWADKWEMEIGHGKCGIMVVGDAEAHAEAKTREWVVQGKPVPVVDVYKYLGVLLDYQLTFLPNTELRVEKGRKALYAVKYILTDRAIPLTVKAVVYKSLVHPVLCYGGELLGLSSAIRLQKLQNLQSRAVRWMAMGSAAANTGIAPLLAELDIPTIRASLAGAKVRAMVKYPTLQTWAGPLASKRKSLPLRAGAAPLWSDRSKGAATQLVANWRDMPAKVAGRAVVKAVSARFLKTRAGTTVGAKFYCWAKFTKTRGYLKAAARLIGDAPAVAWLTRARTGMCWTGHAAAAAGKISMRYRHECIACGKTLKDSVTHLLIHCVHYRPFRPSDSPMAVHLLKARGLSRKPSDAVPRVYGRAALALLLGGSIRRAGKRVGMGPAWLAGRVQSAGAGPGYGVVRLPGESEDHVPGDVDASGVGAAQPAPQLPAFVVIARYVRAVMEAHQRLIRQATIALPVDHAAGDGIGNAGAPVEGHAPRNGGVGHRRRRANAWRRAGQLCHAEFVPQ